MHIEPTELEGCVLLTPRVFADDRGSFCETYNRETLAGHGITLDFVQDNQSISTEVGTIRGLHYQAPQKAQDKLVRCGAGRVVDVVVDVRKGSPTFGSWIAVELSAENMRQILVPKGFLHGFVTRAPHSILLYKTSDTYSGEHDGAVHFASPDIGVDWGVDPAQAITSAKDAKAPMFADWDSPFTYEGNA